MKKKSKIFGLKYLEKVNPFGGVKKVVYNFEQLPTLTWDTTYVWDPPRKDSYATNDATWDTEY